MAKQVNYSLNHSYMFNGYWTHNQLTIVDISSTSWFLSDISSDFDNFCEKYPRFASNLNNDN